MEDGERHRKGYRAQGTLVGRRRGRPRSRVLRRLAPERLRRDGLQVIVKIASIELTPQEPRYPGGSWHVEGLQNEHIVATALFYFDVDNVTPARIAFRQETLMDLLRIPS